MLSFYLCHLDHIHGEMLKVLFCQVDFAMHKDLLCCHSNFTFKVFFLPSDHGMLVCLFVESILRSCSIVLLSVDLLFGFLNTNKLSL